MKDNLTSEELKSLIQNAELSPSDIIQLLTKFY